MATIFKRPGRRYWFAEFRDHTGRMRQRSTKTTDYQDAQLVADRMETEAALRRRGIIDPRADACAKAARVPITKHLADFIEGARARGLSEQQAQQLDTRIGLVLQLARIDTITAISAHLVETTIANIRIGKKEPKPLSIQTATHYARAMKQFTLWLVRENRLASDPLAGMTGMGNPQTDPRHPRRVLDDVELELMIRAAETGPVVRKVRGVDRAMLYRTAIGTGFRKKELKSLTPESFDLEADPPTITVDAAYSKHRKTDVQPIRPELADVLRPWLSQKPAGVPVFQFKCKGVHLVRADLKLARESWVKEAGTEEELKSRMKSSFLQYQDDEGFAEFHALRHGYSTRIVASGASIKVFQELARHSNPVLTLSRYAHTRRHDLTGPLRNLPCPAPTKPEPEAEPMKATGTFNGRPVETIVDTQVGNGQWNADRLSTVKHRQRTEQHGAPSFSGRKRGSDAGAKKAPVGGTGAIG